MSKEEWIKLRNKKIREMIKYGFKTKDIQKELGIDIKLIEKIRGKKKMQTLQK